MEISRRKFLGATAAAVVVAGMKSSGKVYGANERIRMCVIGLNGRGKDHMKGWNEQQDAEIVALCDVDDNVLQRGKGIVQRATDKEPKTYTDMREVFANKDIDAVSIATPNHWHTLATVWACQAGKDVYVEKPATHEFWEGKQIIAAAKKYNRIVQHGTQRRSEKEWIRDIRLLQSGEIIGPLYMARGLCYKSGGRGDLGFKDNQEPPANLHWRLWQGPAKEQPYNPLYHPYNWHWFWNYGNGEIGNQGVHQMDVAVWGMNKGFPVKVFSTGGRYTYKDQGQTPNTNIATYTYADGTELVFEVRNRWTNDEAGVKVGNLFYGDGGYYVEEKGFFDTKDKPIEVDKSKYPYPETAGNYGNFIKAVRSRKQEDIHGTMEDAHQSAGHCHLGNISYRVGRSLEFDPKEGKFKNAPDADALLKRDYEKGFEVPELA